jgi:hypothetical protein
MGILFALISNLNQLELLPGKALPNPIEAISSRQGESGPMPELGWVDRLIRILPYLFLGVLTLAAVLSTIFYRQFRRTRITLIWITVILLAVIFLFERAQKGQWEEQPPTSSIAGSDIETARPSVEIETPQIQPPNWGLILVALTAALGSGVVAAFLIVRIYPGLNSYLKKEKDFLETFGERAGGTVEDIRAGRSFQDAVLRCYKDMSEMLSRKCRIKNAPFLTPREFASALRTQGVEDAHVLRLTALFEQVRYGGRSGNPFVNEAIACLESIQRAYAADGGAT